ncbi:MAG: zf-HC2 domain-containing protein [Oscillibacter sp.]|nr:zf-HC2 domain-containing protein [Oscillibacter sp.]
MKSHEQCAALLDAFIDGALSERDAAEVREHLAECPECRSYVADALSMRELFPGVEETVVPDGFAESVMSSLPAQKIALRTQWKKIALPLAACVAVALLIRGVSVAPTGGAAPAAASADAGGGIAESMTADAEDAATLYGDLEESAPEADENQTAVVTSVAPEPPAAADTGAGGYAAPPEGASYKSASGAGGAETKSARAHADDADTMPPQAAEESAPAPEPSAQNIPAADAAMPELPAEDAAASRKMPVAEESEDTEDMRYSVQSAAQGAGNGAARSDALDGGADLSETTLESGDAPPDTGGGGEYSTDAVLLGAVPSPEEDAVPEEEAVPKEASVESPEEPSAEPPEAREGETSDAVTESFALSATVWTLSAESAPVMERYPPEAVTDGGKWYVLTPPQFEDLCERFPDIEITAGPEIVPADSLPDGAPPLAVSDAVYIFAPNP